MAFFARYPVLTSARPPRPLSHSHCDAFAHLMLHSPRIVAWRLPELPPASRGFDPPILVEERRGMAVAPAPRPPPLYHRRCCRCRLDRLRLSSAIAASSAVSVVPPPASATTHVRWWKLSPLTPSPSVALAGVDLTGVRYFVFAPRCIRCVSRRASRHRGPSRHRVVAAPGAVDCRSTGQ